MTCGSSDITVGAAVGPKLETSGQGEVVGKLYRTSFLPHVHKVLLRPTIWQKGITIKVALNFGNIRNPRGLFTNDVTDQKEDRGFGKICCLLINLTFSDFGNIYHFLTLQPREKTE